MCVFDGYRCVAVELPAGSCQRAARTSLRTQSVGHYMSVSGLGLLTPTIHHVDGIWMGIVYGVGSMATSMQGKGAWSTDLER